MCVLLVHMLLYIFIMAYSMDYHTLHCTKKKTYFSCAGLWLIYDYLVIASYPSVGLWLPCYSILPWVMANLWLPCHSNIRHCWFMANLWLTTLLPFTATPSLSGALALKSSTHLLCRTSQSPVILYFDFYYILHFIFPIRYPVYFLLVFLI